MKPPLEGHKLAFEPCGNFNLVESGAEALRDGEEGAPLRASPPGLFANEGRFPPPSRRLYTFYKLYFLFQPLERVEKASSGGLCVDLAIRRWPILYAVLAPYDGRGGPMPVRRVARSTPTSYITRPSHG